MADDFSTSPIDSSQSKRLFKQEQAEGLKIAVAQEASEISMTEFGEEGAFNAVTMSRRFDSLEKLRKKETEKKELEESDEILIENVQEISELYERKNPELHARALQQLLSQLKKENTAEEILEKVLRSYPDRSLADESLDFLAEATKGDISEKVRQAKENLNNTYGREVRAGRNMAEQAREFSQKGLGSPTGLRDLYREITGNPRETTTLFNELNEKFDYEKMNTVIDFLLHSVGADLKSKGPSISRGELHRLMTEGRQLLAILGVFRFFQSRMNLIKDSFHRAGMLLPARITFEMLAKMFVQFLCERYPSMDKVFQLALKMGLSADQVAQVILFSQMRDGVRNVAPRLFRSDHHRHDVLMSLIEALEELEEALEKEEEQKEKNKKKEQEEEK